MRPGLMRIMIERWTFRFVLVCLVSIGILHSPSVTHAKEVKISLNALTLNANLELADGKALSDGIILITHGTLAHNGMEIVTTVQNLFKDQGLNTLAINLSLGLNDRHGPYDCATPFNHRHTDAVKEIAAWVNWLGQQGADSILVMGHSRGGNQTAWYLSEHDDANVRGAVLIAPATWSAEKAARGYQNQTQKPLPALLADMKKRVANGNGSEMINGISVLYCPDATVNADTFISYYEDNPLKDTPHALTLVDKPVMVIAGSEDTVVSDLAAKMAAPDLGGVRFENIEGAGHFFRDLYADDIADLTADFIENLP